MSNSRKIGLFSLLALLFLLTSCNGTPHVGQEPQEQTDKEPVEQSQSEETHDEQLEVEQPKVQDESMEGLPPTALEAAAIIIAGLKNKDMRALAAWAHSDRGIRFSPYAYVDKETDLVFSKVELEDLMEDSTEYVWGSFAGSGELIKMTYSEYYNKFVYDVEFINDAEIAVNEVIGEGTTVNNLNEVYPKDNHDFVEYHIDGIDPTYEGMDWSSLRLVFEKIGDDHALVGIIHDQWTP
jgi:hypothetical protein